MDRWVLSEAEAARFLRATGLKADHGSPFWTGGDRADSGTSLSTQPTPELKEALQRLARPDMVLGLSLIHI